MNVLACDFGGRRIKLGVVRNGTVLVRQILPAMSDRPLIERLPIVADTLRAMCQRIGITTSHCSAVSIAYPSVIDVPRAKIVDEFGKYGDVSRLDLRAWAQHEFQRPLYIDNDARMALIGEWQYGVGQGICNVVMVTLGTGLGAAAIIDGRPLRGCHGQAGILGGHLTVEVNGRSCVCGNVGCAEAEASTSVLRELAQAIPEYPSSRLASIDPIGYEHIFQLAAEKDQVASTLAAHSLHVWGAMVVQLIHAYDPELVILGGGIMASEKFILPAITDYVHKHAHTPWGTVQIAASQLGDDAALVAGQWLAAEQSRHGVAI